MTSAPPPALPSAEPLAGGYAPAPGLPPRPPLRRSRTDRMLGGVCGGLADYSGIDALLWRIGVVALTLTGGTGIVVYLLLWLLMPAGPRHPRSPTGEAGVERRGRPRSPLSRITVAGLLIMTGLLVLVTRLTDLDPGPRGFLGTALLIVGLGLVGVAFSGGRAAKGGLIALGVVLSLGLIVASAVPWHDLEGGVGDRTFSPDSVAEVRSVYHGGIGDVTLDLSDLDLSDLDGPVETTLDAGVGNVDVLVPDEADVRVRVDLGLGEAEVFGEENTDTGYYRGTGSDPWTGDATPEIVLSIDAGIGDVEVSRA